MTTSCLPRRQFLTTIGIAGTAAALGLPRVAGAAGLSLADVKGSGKLRIGVEAAYVPFTFRKDGKIVGYDVDLADVFCESLGVKPDIVDTAWAGVIPSLYAKKFDMIMSAMTYTAERLQRVAFSIPYAEASQALLIRAADEGAIKGLNDLSKKVVGIKLGSPGEILAKKQSEQVKAATGAGFAEIKIFTEHPAAYLSLAQHKVDAVYNTVPTLAMVLRDQPGKFAMLKGLGADNWAGIAFRKEDTELRQFIDGQIVKLKADGTLGKLQEKWFGFRMNLADKVPAL
jgi:polar amino acid transport system substrate-binding protein